MGNEIYFRIQAWVTNLLIIFFASLVLLRFTKFRDKSAGLYMILILTISDLSFPLMNILTIQFVDSHQAAVIFASISSYINRFSLYWSAAIAIYTYQILVSRDFNEEKFIKKSLIFCCSFVAVFPFVILFQFFGVTIEYVGPGLYGISYPLVGVADKIIYLIIFDFLGYVVPSLVIARYYYKVAQTIKKSYSFIGATGDISSTKSFSFAVIPIICFAPEVLSDCYYIFQNINVYPFGITLIVSILHRSWGFLNLCAFWFLNPLTSSLETSSSGSSIRTTRALYSHRLLPEE